MKTRYLYPGSFCPPTWGHYRLVEEISQCVPQLTIVCSHNQEKNDRWFSEEDCLCLWKSYPMPDTVNVETFSSVLAQNIDHHQVVMIRGVRNESDFQWEKRVVWENFERFGVNKYLFFVSQKEYAGISSSQARVLAGRMDLENLHQYVSPLVTSALLEKVLEIDHLFLAVGRPGTGKSTLLNQLCQEWPNSGHVNTDDFSEQLKPLIAKRFPGSDLVTIALTREDELKQVIGRQWMALLKDRLEAFKGKNCVFVEIPYGLERDKLMFRYLGGKVIYFQCDEAVLKERVFARGTPELLPFIDKIPGLDESISVAQQYGLRLAVVNTMGNMVDAYEQMKFEITHLMEAEKYGTLIPSLATVAGAPENSGICKGNFSGDYVSL